MYNKHAVATPKQLKCLESKYYAGRRRFFIWYTKSLLVEQSEQTRSLHYSATLKLASFIKLTGRFYPSFRTTLQF